MFICIARVFCKKIDKNIDTEDAAPAKHWSSVPTSSLRHPAGEQIQTDEIPLVMLAHRAHFRRLHPRVDIPAFQAHPSDLHVRHKELSILHELRQTARRYGRLCWQWDDELDQMETAEDEADRVAAAGEKPGQAEIDQT